MKLLLVIFLLVLEVLAKPSKPRIINGDEVEAHSIPYQVLLEVFIPPGLDPWYYSGSLISPNYILTAAQSISNSVEITAILGAHRAFDIEDTQEVYGITDFIVHPEYDHRTHLNNIALIKLPKSVTPNEYIQIASLPQRSDINNTYVDEIVRLSGWGLTNVNNPDSYSEVLLGINEPIISLDDCMKSFIIVNESNLCSRGDSTATCYGDLGGPVVVNGTQIGVISAAQDYMCVTNHPSVITKIAYFLDWIAENSDIVV